MKTNIAIIDVMSFREAANSSRILLRREFEPIGKEILNRVLDTEQRIGSTDSVDTLFKLDAFKKFLKSISAQFDQYNKLIDQLIDGFNAIDDLYWATVLNGQKLADENNFLKSALANTQKQRDQSTDWWIQERKKWNIERVIKRVGANEQPN